MAYLFDTNVWIALTFASHPHHSRAVATYSELVKGDTAYFCRATQQSFLRVSTTPTVLEKFGATNFSNADALQTLNQLLSLPTVGYQDEPSGVVPVWHRLASRSTAAPKLWMDAYLAAFAIADNLQLVTFDRDFKAFQKDGLQLNWIDAS